MAWIAVNKDGTEIISPNQPKRWCNLEYKSLFGNRKTSYISDTISIERIRRDNPEMLCFWIDYRDIDSDFSPKTRMEIPIPKGTIKKIIGREMSWSDNPIFIGV